MAKSSSSQPENVPEKTQNETKKKEKVPEKTQEETQNEKKDKKSTLAKMLEALGPAGYIHPDTLITGAEPKRRLSQGDRVGLRYRRWQTELPAEPPSSSGSAE